MSSSIIQHQIKLLGFRAQRASLQCESVVSIDVQPDFNLELSDILFEDKSNSFVKVFNLDVSVINIEKSELVKIKVEYHTFFETSSEITTEFMQSDFVKVSAPAIGFPYLRAFISTFTLQAGLQPVILPSINFIQFNKEAARH